MSFTSTSYRRFGSLTRLLTLLGTASCALVAAQTTYYVSPGGSDSATGTSPAAALATLQEAANRVAGPGDAVRVAAGTYAGFDLRGVDGTAAQPISFSDDGSGTVLIDQPGPVRDDGINIENADHVTVEGFTVIGMPGAGNGIRVVTSAFVTVRDCVCRDNAERGIFTGFADDLLIEGNVCTGSVDEHGIYLSNSGDRPVVRYNSCSGNNNIGIHLNADVSAGGDGVISDAQVYGNVIFDNNRAAGINMDGLLNPVVYNNLIYDNHDAQGIAAFRDQGAIATQGARIYNNTILVPSDGRWGILINTGASATIHNNIILNDHPWRGSIAAFGTSNVTSDHNVLTDRLNPVDDGPAQVVSMAQWRTQTGLDANSVVAPLPTALFANPGAGDYSLMPGSVAVDAGTSVVSGFVTDDIDGIARPQGAAYDVGAYEAAAPLPVILVEAVRSEWEVATGRAVVTWATGLELDVEAFRVERSQDLRSWELVEDVVARGGVSHVAYRVVDQSRSVHDATQVVYYLVEELQRDGTRVELGRAALAPNRRVEFGLSVRPNPSSEFVQIELPEHVVVERFRLLDGAGATVRVLDGRLRRLPLLGLSAGQHVIVAELSDGRRLQQAVIVR